MTDGTEPPIPPCQPVAQVGRAGRTTDQKRKADSFEERLADGGGHPRGERPDRLPPLGNPEEHERAWGALEDGTGESLDVTA